MNIIIPLGGLGVRFKEEQYLMPKPLIKVLGKELIFHLLDNLVFRSDDHIYMIITRELEKYGFSDTIHAKYPDVNILFLDKQTEGAVETVLIGLNQIADIKTKSQRKTVLLDCDNFYTTDILRMYRELTTDVHFSPKVEKSVIPPPADKNLQAPYLTNANSNYNSDANSDTNADAKTKTNAKTKTLNDYKQSGLDKPNAIVCFKDNQSNPIYSYLKFDGNKNITEIKEKVRISDYANTGCYCFSDIETLRKYCKIIIEQNIRQKNEYYMSGLVQKMIEDNHSWYAIEIAGEHYHCLGTPFQLKLYCNKNLLEAEKKRICFDLDNTLVSSPAIKGDYSTVRPILRNIEYLRFLKKVGHTIIIYTARRMKTHNGNVGKVIQDIGQVTINTLEKFDIPYDELLFGKPYADFYIDDLAVNSNFDLEKELGIYKTSIQERSFNELSSSKIEVITKKSQTIKIQGEIHWYKNIPIPLRDLFPALISYGTDYYTMEKINGITLSYLYVNESLSIPLFTKFLESIHRIHSFSLHLDTSKETSKETSSNINIYANYAKKLEERYKNYDYSKLGKHCEKIYEKLLQDLLQYEERKVGQIGLIHGDPVFSNVLIDNHNNIKLIDMRGVLGDKLTLEGDIFYDYAKIYQSLLGYDEILLGKMVSGRYKSSLIEIFNSFIVNLYGLERLNKISILSHSLIFTLIPLHDNEKCKDYLKLIS